MGLWSTGFLEKNGTHCKLCNNFTSSNDEICENCKAIIKHNGFEQIVKCKDCKHSEQWYGDKSRCFLWQEDGIDVFNNGFCNYGELAE